MIFELLWIGATLFFHELGHYFPAKALGIYKGWGILPTPHIKMTKSFPNRWYYLGGIAMSYCAFPLFHLCYGGSVIGNLFVFTIFACVIGCVDVFIFCYYGKIEIREVKN